MDILIVEDDRDIRESLREILESWGYSVGEAENGEVACSLIRAGLRPRVILLDLMMPVMDGWTFLDERKKNNWLHIPVVVISASGTCIHAGDILCFIAKPIDLSKLERYLPALSQQ